MQQPSSSAAPRAPAPSSTEVVTRPEPGLARGVWEAPSWAFWVLLALVVLGATAYVLRRFGVLGRGKPEAASPPSSRMRRP